MMIHYLLASSLETIINTTIHNDLLRDGLCLKVIFVCFKYDDDFITWEFRNLLIEFIKKKKKVLHSIFLFHLGLLLKPILLFYFFFTARYITTWNLYGI